MDDYYDDQTEYSQTGDLYGSRDLLSGHVSISPGSSPVGHYRFPIGHPSPAHSDGIVMTPTRRYPLHPIRQNINSGDYYFPSYSTLPNPRVTFSSLLLLHSRRS